MNHKIRRDFQISTLKFYLAINWVDIIRNLFLVSLLLSMRINSFFFVFQLLCLTRNTQVCIILEFSASFNYFLFCDLNIKHKAQTYSNISFRKTLKQCSVFGIFQWFFCYTAHTITFISTFQVWFIVVYTLCIWKHTTELHKNKHIKFKFNFTFYTLGNNVWNNEKFELTLFKMKKRKKKNTMHESAIAEKFIALNRNQL